MGVVFVVILIVFPVAITFVVGLVIGFARIVGGRAFQDLVELAPVQPDTPAIGTIIDFYALAVSNGIVDLVEGPYVATPLITTGAGDHFNSGFCLGKLLGLNNAMSVLTGVTTSGYYVRSAKSPNILQLAEMLRNWPARQ